MPKTVSYNEGDGALDDKLAINVQIPDVNGATVLVGGNVSIPGGIPLNSISASVVFPVAPASGVMYFNIQVDPYVAGGNVTIQSSSASPPSPLASGDGNGTHLQRIVYSDMLATTSLDPALDGGVTPDQPTGSP